MKTTAATDNEEYTLGKRKLPYIGFYNPATVQTYLVGCSAMFVDLNFQPRI